MKQILLVASVDEDFTIETADSVDGVSLGCWLQFAETLAELPAGREEGLLQQVRSIISGAAQPPAQAEPKAPGTVPVDVLIRWIEAKRQHQQTVSRHIDIWGLLPCKEREPERNELVLATAELEKAIALARSVRSVQPEPSPDTEQSLFGTVAGAFDTGCDTEQQEALDNIRCANLDREFCAGARAGFQASQLDEPYAALQQLLDSRAGYVGVLRESRAVLGDTEHQRRDAEAFMQGDRVRAACDLYEDGEDLPPFLYAKAGDLLIVRGVHAGERCYSVAHEGVDDSWFQVSPSELVGAAIEAEGKA